MVTLAEKTRSFSLAGHVMVGVLMIHIVLLPVLYVTIIDIYKKNVEEQFVGHVREVSGLLSDVIAINKSIKNSVVLMESALLSGEVVYIELVDHKGEKLFSKEDANLITEEFIEDRFIGEHGDNIYFISVPVQLQLKEAANIRLKLGFDEEVVVERLTLVKQSSLIILGAYFISIILLLSYLTNVIMRPLKVLREWSKTVASGETSKNIDVASNISEVKDLFGDLENMRLSLCDLAERMQYKAMHDELTGLPNRTLNNDRINQAISRAERTNGSFAILLLDLNRFKDINDTLGHGVGDEVLKIVADRLELGIRDSDTVARIGGDEFCAIIEGVECVVAEKLAIKLANVLEPTFQINGNNLQIGASIGIAVYPENGTSHELLIQHADVAMYEAKYHGMNVVSYHEDMDKNRAEELQLATDLREGIKADQFFAVFQPKIDLKSGKPCGCELLTRWSHPRIGLISPVKFIPIIERENMIGEMTRRVFEKHVMQLKKLIDIYPDFKVSLNVSPLNLLDTSLLGDLKDSMSNSGFKSSSLVIEVTENAIMTNPLRSAGILREFSAANIGVSVDDFGTGYSSLAYLQKFPINELKIDQSFIINLRKDSQNYPIVNATVTMAHDLGMSVIAEGVEEGQVIDLLTELNCDQAQGSYFSEPLSYDELTEWLDKFDITDYD